MGRRRAARAVPQAHGGVEAEPRSRQSGARAPLEEGSFWALDESPLCLRAAAIAKDQQICSIGAIGQVQWKLDRGQGATL